MDKPSIERRGRDLSNQIRRLCYGLALAYSMAPLASEGTEATLILPMNATRSDNILLNLEPARDQVVYAPFKALGRNYSDDSARPVLRHTTFQTDELSILRAGVGVDLNLSSIGNMHFNLYSPDGDLNKGKRWTFGAPEQALPSELKKIWSVGGKLDYARNSPGGPRTVIFVPQLMFNLEKFGSKAQMTFEYQHWNGGGEGNDDRPIAQISIKWEF